MADSDLSMHSDRALAGNPYRTEETEMREQCRWKLAQEAKPVFDALTYNL